MRGHSSSRLSSEGNLSTHDSAANSLFWKILPVSPFDPRFCGRKSGSSTSNFHEFNILRTEIRKKEIARIPSTIDSGSLTNTDPPRPSTHSLKNVRPSKRSTNSLFWKILPVSPFNPRFCGHETISQTRKSNESKILRKVIRKISRADHTARTSIPAPPPPLQLTAAPAPSPSPRPEHFFRSASSSRRSSRSSPTWPSRCCGVRATCGHL
jgi:hypothetical protein